MKKFLSIVLLGVILFAASDSDINKKLDLILQQIQQLKQEVKQKDKEINQLKSELQQQKKEIKKQEQKTQKEFAIKNCNRLKVVSLKYKYENEIIPYYKLTIKIKNTYPKEVTFIRGSLFAEDKDRVKILQDYISRNVDIKVGRVITIKKKHIIGNDLEKYLKDENPKNLKIYFSPTRIEFKDGQVIECN